MVTATKCPKCGSDLIQPITNALRCGQCGEIFNVEKDSIGKRARAEKRGLWLKRNAET